MMIATLKIVFERRGDSVASTLLERRGVKSKCPPGEEGERTPSWRGGEKTLLERRVREHTHGEEGREHPPGEEGERRHSWRGAE